MVPRWGQLGTVFSSQIRRVFLRDKRGSRMQLLDAGALLLRGP